MAGTLEERRQWLTQAAEQAEKDRALAECQVQAAKKSLASENDIRVGSREVRCSPSIPSTAQRAPTAQPRHKLHSYSDGSDADGGTLAMVQAGRNAL